MLRNNALILALVGVVALVGAIVLAALHDPIPEFVPSIALAAIGALAGIAIPQVNVVTQSSQELASTPRAGTPPSDPTPPAPVSGTITAVPPSAA